MIRLELGIIACTVVFLAHTSTARAEETTQDPRAFVDAVFSRASWDDMKGDVTLTLTNKRGDTKVRKIEMISKKNDKGETRMLMRFLEPADVRGTGFLLIEHENGEDDRRLYLPALRQVKRISASGSGGNFMSSDFTYYDIGRPDLDDWTYSFQGTRQIDGTECRIVEAAAANDKVTRDTGYSKIVWYVDPSRMVALAADYYDKTGTKFKVMHVLEFQDVSGVPFATHMRMADQVTGHTSEMVFSNLQTNVGLDDALFTERNLRRWTR